MSVYLVLQPRLADLKLMKANVSVTEGAITLKKMHNKRSCYSVILDISLQVASIIDPQPEMSDYFS
jgi:hypothetical protein